MNLMVFVDRWWLLILSAIVFFSAVLVKALFGLFIDLGLMYDINLIAYGVMVAATTYVIDSILNSVFDVYLESLIEDPFEDDTK